MMHKAEKESRRKASEHPEYKAFADLMKNNL